jgi:hypothetical protein
MSGFIKAIQRTPLSGVFSLFMVWFSLALGHTLVVLQQGSLPMGAIDTTLSFLLGLAGFALVWMGMKRPENQATLLGWVGGAFIWCGWFEWTWRYTAHLLEIDGIYDNGMLILSPELLMIQATTMLVVAMLIFFGANKDTRCRMFLWFHRNLKLKPDTMTAGYKRQYARIAALETVFLIWGIYLFAIFFNDPRGIRYDSITAMLLTLLFVIWGCYLAVKMMKIRGLGAAFRYAIPTGNILWLPIEGFARWGLYPEVWVKPVEYPLLMSSVFILFLFGCVSMYMTDRRPAPQTATPAAA